VSFIKICGLTSAAAVEAARAAQADAIGFVFADSPRQLTPADAARLAAPVRGRLAIVAVTRQPTQTQLEAILEELAPDVLQSDLTDLAQLRLPRTLALLPVLREHQVLPAMLPPRVLFEGAASGAGVPCDWSSARELAARTQLVLAGGLSATTVAAAVAAVRPFGVDVSSGVEERPGVKSPQKIERFVAAARAALRTLAQPCREVPP